MLTGSRLLLSYKSLCHRLPGLSFHNPKIVNSFDISMLSPVYLHISSRLPLIPPYFPSFAGPSVRPRPLRSVSAGMSRSVWTRRGIRQVVALAPVAHLVPGWDAGMGPSGGVGAALKVCRCVRPAVACPSVCLYPLPFPGTDTLTRGRPPGAFLQPSHTIRLSIRMLCLHPSSLPGTIHKRERHGYGAPSPVLMAPVSLQIICFSFW